MKLAFWNVQHKGIIQRIDKNNYVPKLKSKVEFLELNYDILLDMKTTMLIHHLPTVCI